ncbi:hypothetical protein [Pseudomonas guariconensis]|nr:hypothetical protein [Pseudomonas guariconensis]MCO7596470.1 hypothetical protein [Pseudomonas guariconensis]MCU7222488.1 hypothetical protein [Pseudomonas brassicacearum]
MLGAHEKCPPKRAIPKEAHHEGNANGKNQRITATSDTGSEGFAHAEDQA